MRPRQRRSRPDVERCEPRDLLSILSWLATSPTATPRPPLAEAAQNAAVSLGATPTLQAAGGSNQTPGPPLVPGPGQPTPRELARQQFRAVFSGPFYAGPPRFTDQAKILHFRGLGGSTSFLHGDFQMDIIIPKDPAQGFFGAAYLQDKNINSGGALAFDLVADPTSLDSRGRPTRATFVADPNIYSGLFYFNTAQGTVQIRYFNGSAAVKFSGLVYTNGITNPLRNQDLQSRGGRLFPRGT